MRLWRFAHTPNPAPVRRFGRCVGLAKLLPRLLDPNFRALPDPWTQVQVDFRSGVFTHHFVSGIWPPMTKSKKNPPKKEMSSLPPKKRTPKHDKRSPVNGRFVKTSADLVCPEPPLPTPLPPLPVLCRQCFNSVDHATEILVNCPNCHGVFHFACYCVPLLKRGQPECPDPNCTTVSNSDCVRWNKVVRLHQPHPYLGIYYSLEEHSN